MNELAVSTSNILNSIEPALTKLSETFCVSVDYLKENAMQYIIMYGRYELVANILGKIIGLSIVSGVTIGIAVLIGWFLYDEYGNHNKSYNWKKIVKISSKIAISFILMVVIFQSIIYFSSPEIYSIKRVLELIQSIK